MKIKQHLPSHISTAGSDALISYDGQAPTWYRCNETGLQQIEFPRMKRLDIPVIDRLHSTCADIVSNKSQAVQPDMTIHQKNKMHGSKTESTCRSLDNTTDTKRRMHAQGLQGTSEEMELGEYQFVNEPKVQDTQNADPPQMDTQESFEIDETLARNNIAFNNTTDSQYDTEKAITYSTLSDEDMPVLGSHAKDLSTMVASSRIRNSNGNQSVGVTPES